MDDRTIQKETQQVTVVLSDGTQIDGEVFLRLHEAHHTGRQKIGDLLNQDLSFIPIRTSKGFILLNRSQIVSVKIKQEFEKDEIMTLGKKYAVRVRTVQGKEVVGDMFVNLPEESCRIKDHLNQPIRFFSLFQSASILYINREFILSVQD
jgi:hypothetical protein